MKPKIAISFSFLLLIAGGFYYSTKYSVTEDVYIPLDIETSEPELVSVPLKELEIIFELPEGWTIDQNAFKNAWYIDSPDDEPTGIWIEPEGFYYHNPIAGALQDYITSYRSGWDLAIIIDSSKTTTIDGEPALFQMYRAGDSYINGVLDTTSIASVYGSSPRYVVRHPESKEFIIVSDRSAGSVQSFQEIVERMRFIKK